MDIRSIIGKVIKRPSNQQDVYFNNILFDTTDTMTIGGAKSSGKSYFMNVLANLFPAVVFFDSRWERFTKNEKSSISVKAQEMPEKWIVTGNPDELNELLLRGKTHIIYHPQPLRRNKRDRDDLIEEFNQVAQIIYDQGNITFFVDECDGVCDLWHIPEGMYNILEYGK